MFSCDEVITACGLERHHCESCHEDYDMGEGMCTLTDPEGREIYVCCDVVHMLKAKGIADQIVFQRLGVRT